MRGSAVFYKPCDITVTPERTENPEAERVRFAQAQRKAVEDIEHLCESAVELVGAEAAQIFEVHKMMVEADEFVELVSARLDEGYCAPHAVQQAGQEYDNAITINSFLLPKIVEIR